MPRAKGETIDTFAPWKIVPLFLEDNNSKSEASLFSTLPRYQASEVDVNPLAGLLKKDEAFRNLPEEAHRGLQKLFRGSKDTGDWWATFVVKTTIEIVLQDVNAAKVLRTQAEEGGGSRLDKPVIAPSQDEEEIVAEAWTWIQDYVSWKDWSFLHGHVSDHLYIVPVQHPLEIYATKVVPRLTRDEVHIVVGMLGIQGQFSSSSSSNSNNNNQESTLALRLSQLLRESNPPRQYGILTKRQPAIDFRHSCLPNAAFEIASPTLVKAIHLYDSMTESPSRQQMEVCTSPLDGGSLERQARLRCQREGKQCLLCQYETELSTIKSSSSLSWSDAVRLGHYCFQQERYSEAASLYKLALKQNDTLDDIRHALGALELAQNHFLAAQLSWKETSEMIESLGRNPQDHPGIALQLEKQQSYHYFEEHPPSILIQGDSLRKYSYKSFFDDQCFISPMLDKETCQKLIESATSHGHWTTNRHYAVPTNDIPIHSEPNLLDWFYPWMEEQCAPLLMKQFGIDNTNLAPKQRFYVHDAFFVRYQGSKETNHLPCHCDECTHSFVICLNDDFEGGGTYFHDYNTTLVPKIGEVVSFKGDTIRHGGDAVTKGTRYIIAVFCYLDRCAGVVSDNNKRSPEVSSNTISNNNQNIQSLFQEAKKQKTDFSFGFTV